MRPPLCARACAAARAASGLPAEPCARCWRAADFIFVTVSTIGFGDVVMRYDGVGYVLLQYLLFLPGLALFTEYVTLGIGFGRSWQAPSELLHDV